MQQTNFAHSCLAVLEELWEFRMLELMEHDMLLSPTEHYLLSRIVQDLQVLTDSVKSRIDQQRLHYLQREEIHCTDIWKDAAITDVKVRRYYQTNLLRNLAQVLLEDLGPRTATTPNLKVGKMR